MLDHPHDRLVDVQPAETGYTGIGMVLPFNVPSSVKICIDLIPAGTTHEERLCRSIPLVHEAASRAPLAGMSRVNGLHAGTNLFGLVCYKGPKLGITPTMVPSPLTTTTLFGAAANVGQIFNDNYAARLRVLNDALAQNVVAILPKPCLSPSHLFKMAFSRLAAFGLKITTKPEVPLFYLLPSPLSEELPVGQNGGSVNAEIDSDGFSRSGDFRWINGYHNVEPPARSSLCQVGTVKAYSTIKPPFCLGMDTEWKLYAASYRRQTYDPVLRFHTVGSGVIADATPRRFRSRDFLSLFLDHDCGFYGFSRLHPSRDHQLARQSRVFRPKFVVRRFVKRDAILLTMLPAELSHGVEAVPRSGKRLCQDFVLFRERRQTYAKRALHTSYITRFLHLTTDPSGQLAWDHPYEQT